MKDLLIFGRSPFINKLDLSNINYDKYDVLCINYPIPDIKVHYCLGCDEWTKPVLAPKTQWISIHTGYNFIKTCDTFHHDGYNLSWCCFSSSAAISFAISKGYKNCYLIGIDLLENNKPLTHYDGITNSICTKSTACKKEKKYIKEMLDFIQIYQTNKEVKDDWDIPFCDISNIIKNHSAKWLRKKI